MKCLLLIGLLLVAEAVRPQSVPADSEALAAPVILPTPGKVIMEGNSCSFSGRGTPVAILDPGIAAEGYELQITPAGVMVRYSDKNGLLYAGQTLRQLQYQYRGGKGIPCMEISDAPRVGWRCFMLDSGCQYQSVVTVKKYIDMAALLKMNRFHWHLTEGSGWRIEIKKYPALTSVGAFVGKGKEQQGFYTQQQIKEIVAYATERGITVVPEIDMPGHAEAALYAYPGMGCFDRKPEIPETGFTPELFCAGKDRTIRFLEEVLDEVCMLFPSEYIHLGGDEAPKSNWDKCPDCLARMHHEKLKNSHELQLWFSSQLASYLRAKGRKAIFWGDVVYKDGYKLPDNAVIQWWNWRGHKNLAFRNALENGYPVICNTNDYTYLNFPTVPWKGYGPDRTFGLREAYLHNPSYLPDTYGPSVLGMGCSLWTDYGLTEEMLDERLFPRILAIAEQMWHCGTLTGYPEFLEKVRQKRGWLESLGYRYGPE
ncbi:MAG: beta-N-acetylhexosaminidase [Parabacteroides sp.]|nr:beta-N-acetylhexosaminidase [Parabacteroides sp.]